MRPQTIIKTGIIIVLVCILLALLQRIPRSNSTSTVQAPDTNGRKNSGQPQPAERPSDIGNRTAEDMLRKVERKPAVPESGLITVTDETFSPAYDELYDNREKYYGREIDITGYVETQPGLAANQFLIGRDLLWCCENDTYFIGFLVITNETVPEPDTSLHVRGILEAVSYTDPETGKSFDVPAIRAQKIESVQGIAKEVFPG